ncbi:MAG: translation initiation factor IF-6 [Candidatus Woesearchaeota archaeon]
MKTEILSFNGINTVGLYGYATNNYVLIGQEVQDRFLEELEKIFDVPIHKITIAGTSLIGVFLNGTEEKLLVPNIAFDSELKKLDDLKIPYEVIETKFTCLGNNLLIGKKEGLINSEFSDEEVKKIEKILGIKLHKYKLSDIEAIGSIAVLNEDKGLISNNITDKEYKEIQKILGVELTPGTLNMGSEYIKSSILINKNGLIIGKGSGGPEIANADQAFRD